MRKLVVVEFLSVDGVMQGPGGPEEDVESGFRHGGWAMPYNDEVFMERAVAGMAETDAQLFGRKTYDIMASYWPNAPADDPFGKHLNAIDKYVASRTLTEATWQNTTILDDVPGQIADLKQQSGRNISVLGSGDLVQTLIANDLVDEYSLAVCPIVLGDGKRLFRKVEQVRRLDLVEAVTTTTGAQLLTYRPAR